MITIALIAQKGGTGKTTLARCLAVAFERRSRSAAIIDLDPQASAYNWSKRRKDLYPEVKAIPEPLLEETLAALADNAVGYTIIDTPGRGGELAIAAARAADLIVIPCRAQLEDMETLRTVRQILDVTGVKPHFVFLSQLPPHASRKREATTHIESHQSYPLSVCPHSFGHRAAFGDSGRLGLTPEEYEPNGKAAGEIVDVYKYVCRVVDENACQSIHERVPHDTSANVSRRRA